MSKPYLTIDEQMKVLTDMKGLIVSDEKSAKEMLTDIGYFSLIGGYKRSFINPMTRNMKSRQHLRISCPYIVLTKPFVSLPHF